MTPSGQSVYRGGVSCLPGIQSLCSCFFFSFCLALVPREQGPVTARTIVHAQPECAAASSPCSFLPDNPENMEVATGNAREGAWTPASTVRGRRRRQGRVDLALLDLGRVCVHSRVPGLALALAPSPCAEPDVPVAPELDRSGWIDHDATVTAGLVRLQWLGWGRFYTAIRILSRRPKH